MAYPDYIKQEFRRQRDEIKQRLKKSEIKSYAIILHYKHPGIKVRVFHNVMNSDTNFSWEALTLLGELVGYQVKRPDVLSEAG